MSSRDEIKMLLERFRADKTIIKELSSKYSIGEILNVAIKNNMNDIIIELFQPIEINGEYKQFYDYYSITSEDGDCIEIDSDAKKYLIEMRNVIDIDNPNTRSMKLKNSLARQICGWCCGISCEQAVRMYAEPACLETMLYLYRSNIETTMNDTRCVENEAKEGICEVWINYETLSDENKEEVNKLIEEGLAKFISGESVKTISIFVPCKEDDTIGEVSDRLMELTRRFKKQISYRGLLNIDSIFFDISKSVKKFICNDENIPGREEKFKDLFNKYINEGLLKPLRLNSFQKLDREYELLPGQKEIYFSTIEFLKIIKELEPELLDGIILKAIKDLERESLKSPALIDVIKRYSTLYHDEEGRYWASKEDYDNYIEEKREIEAEKIVKS